MDTHFLNQSELIQYNTTSIERRSYSSMEEIILKDQNELVNWLNTYGLHFNAEIHKVIIQNQWDDFLIKLLMVDDHPNKVIQLEGLLFVSVNVLVGDGHNLDTDQMIFIIGQNFLWSIQEKDGDYFDWIRDRLANNIGIVRRKKSDYLLFLLLESVLDNYMEVFEKYTDTFLEDLSISTIKLTPEFTAMIEGRKQNLFRFKRASTSLRETISKLEKVDMAGFKGKYFIELKEQTNHLLTDIEFELQEQESLLNLIFSYQGHRLNEVMKTLTIFSVIFIPLTFLAGIYGMNFVNIPELQSPYGYFILLGVMLIVALICIGYFKKKKWF